jgi:uncharacterized protein (DUF433 family)
MDQRIVTNPNILNGKPCVRGTRISVELILEWIATGASAADIVTSYPQLSVEDIQEAVRYAAHVLHGTEMADVELVH